MKRHTILFVEEYGSTEILNNKEFLYIPGITGNNDADLPMNRQFEYIILEPENAKHNDEGKISSYIFLFHGLNERSWDKYESWGEALAERTGRAVVMFPLALHINRSPSEWSNLRLMKALVTAIINRRKKVNSLSVANAALSTRIKENPLRFYLSGKQTVYNICQLIDQIDKGEHTIIGKGAAFDIFAYSIGAMLSQVMVQSNPGNRFSAAKVFLFCGGSLFDYMNGESRLILDRDSFKVLKRYYRRNFLDVIRKKSYIDDIDNAFLSLVNVKCCKKERLNFYKHSKSRLRIVSLKKDRVIPTKGIKKAIGPVWHECLEELDFNYKYSHEMPFPLNIREKDSREYWFGEVFKRAAEFLL
jgi:hypothetical protein